MHYDAAIIGGGPAGSTAATMLKKYRPSLRVAVFEREKYPRDHVGESLLPIVCRVLNEMGCYDEVEGAGFPVKIGATYRWGSTDDLWDFDFLGGGHYDDPPRPAKYEGQRTKTAFQVDRSIYDKILLDHARSLGAEVLEDTKVLRVEANGNHVDGLVLDGGREVTADFYVDASGHSGILRRAVGVESLEPSPLRNIAVWAYWQNADWAVNIGVSGTRIQVMSLGWGWLWFIPLGPTRTSLGLVMPVDYYKKSGISAEALYFEAVKAEPRIASLLHNAACEGETFTTKDWSFIASNMVGENWFLIGESAGFADPILSAGLTLAQVGAWEAAITIIELMEGRFDGHWLRREFERQQNRRIRTHIQFADYWYRANAHFTDLIEYVSTIAKDAGVALDAKTAWQWLGTGGFVDTDMGGAGVGGFTLFSVAWLVNDFSQAPPEWHVSKNNRFWPNLDGADEDWIAAYRPGFVERIPAYRRGDKMLPATDACQAILEEMAKTPKVGEIAKRAAQATGGNIRRIVQVLEAMANDGWVRASYDPSSPLLDLSQMVSTGTFHKNIDNKL